MLFAPSPAEVAIVNQIFVQADPQKLGLVTGEQGVRVFAGAKLPPTTLGEIWGISDPESNGALTRRGVAIAVRLIGWAQNGETPSSELVEKVGPLAVIDGLALPVVSSLAGRAPAPFVTQPFSLHALVPADRAKFLGLFNKTNLDGGLLRGDQARNIFLRSKLPMERLNDIWNLVDTQNRGSLDSAQFILAMYFIQGSMTANPTIPILPPSIPPFLWDQAGGRPPSVHSHNSGEISSLRSHFMPGKNAQVSPLPFLATPDDTDLEVLESEPYLAKHFGLHVPNLSGQVRRLDKGTMFYGTYSTVYSGMYGYEKVIEVAIKVLRKTKQGDNIDRKFRRELLIWWHLKHDNILPLYGYLEDEEGGESFPSLISKWAEHGSAAQYITRDLRWDQRTSLLYDVAKGLKHLHTFNPLVVVVHADLKPQNVVVTIHGVGQLCDFGLTRFMHDANSDLTTTTTHTGTTRYLAYELVRQQGKPIPTVATDIYALGCLGLEFIYQIRPHASLGTNNGKINYDIFSAIPPAKRPADPEEVVPLLWDLVEACWSEAPEERPTATQVSDYLAVNLEALTESLEECSWDPNQ